MVRIKSERELKWEQEHSKEIEESLNKMRIENYQREKGEWDELKKEWKKNGKY